MAYHGLIEIGHVIYCFRDRHVQEYLKEIKPGPLFEKWVRGRIRMSKAERKFYSKPQNKEIKTERNKNRRIVEKEKLNGQSREYYRAHKDHLNTLQRYFRPTRAVDLVPADSYESLVHKQVICRE